MKFLKWGRKPKVESSRLAQASYGEYFRGTFQFYELW
jgi:hypothetical protein